MHFGVYSLHIAKGNLERYLTTDLELYRKQRESDGQGGSIETYTLVQPFKGRISVVGRGARETRLTDKWAAEVDAVLYVTEPFDIKRQDEVRGANGRRWRVVAVEEPSLADVHLEVALQEVQPGE